VVQLRVLSITAHHLLSFPITIFDGWIVRKQAAPTNNRPNSRPVDLWGIALARHPDDPRPMTSFPVRLAAGPFGSTRLALVLAVTSLPAVLVGMPAYEGVAPPDMMGRMSPFSLAVLSMTIPAVLASALIAGSVGGWLERRRKSLGGVATFVLAWVVAIMALPLGPGLVGKADGCCSLGPGGHGLLITDLASGVRGVAGGWWISPLFAPGPFLVLLVGVIVWARAIRADVRASRAVSG
jgi:hypothetical protein